MGCRPTVGSVLRFFVLGVLLFLAAVTVIAGAIGGPGWWVLVAVLVLWVGRRMALVEMR